MSEPTVRVSGIVLASLMFQHVNSDSDVEGLVFGESRFDEQVTISDSQSDHIHIEEIYNVQKHVASHRLNTLYSSSGEMNMEVLQEMLANNKQDSVIGWYRQRRNTEQRMTFREKLVHEKLKSALSNPHVIFLLLTPSRATPTGSTHWTEYSAFISRNVTVRAEPRNNLILMEAIRALLGHAPLLLTQTVNQQACPVPDISTETQGNPETVEEQLPSLEPSMTTCRRRLRETLPVRERKRRRSKS
ncbi:BRCA1-A complex subunit Abraxas 1-like [Xenentodon cancila]